MRRTSPVVGVAAALALTACSSAGGGPGPTAGQTGDGASPTSTTPSGGGWGASSSSSSTPTDTGDPFDPQEFTNRLEKAVEKNPTVQIDVQVRLDEKTTASAHGVQNLATNSLDMHVNLGGQKLGYLLVDGQYYLAQGPKWVPVTKDSNNALIQQTLEQIQILSMRNQLDAFIAGVEDAGIKGTEQVDGVKTTHYTAKVDTTESLAALDMKRAEGVPETVIYDVWLDEDDLIRKMSFTQNGATATMTATNWGEPIDIDKPTESELAEPPSPPTPS